MTASDRTEKEKTLKIMQDNITGKYPSIGGEVVGEHLSRMPESYLDTFDEDQIAGHLRQLSELREDRTCILEVIDRDSLSWQVNLFAWDYLGLFSLIAGTFASLGLSIDEGMVWTYGENEENRSGAELGKLRWDIRTGRYVRQAVSGGSQPGLGGAKKIVDIFMVHSNEISPPDWKAIEHRLNSLIGMIKDNRTSDARHQVNRAVVDYLSRDTTADDKLLPIEVEIDNDEDPRFTIMDIDGEDTPAFLYLFTNALSMQGIYIQSLRIATASGRVKDKLYITDSHGKKIEATDKIDQLRFIVVLVKQFSHLLTRSPDPAMAVENFEQLVERIYKESKSEEVSAGGWNMLNLQERTTMDALARLFGTSNFLWEDFLRLQYENLLPLFSDLSQLDNYKDKATIWAECELELADAESYEEAVNKLNMFKDREMFRIDMRHIMRKLKTFTEFTRELTDLAEVVIESAYRICDRELHVRHGTPRLEDERICRFAVFALGKAGGRELGYASDIELLFVYSDSGKTDGAESIGNHQYFEKLVQLMIRSIRSKDKGIFEIDLRFRPYGNQGPLSNTLRQFEEYYSENGPAWDFERQCMVRLRFIAGDNVLGEKVGMIRDRFVYSKKPLDMKELTRLRYRQLEEFIKPGTWNAKFSRGGLVDLEYHVQHLEIELGAHDENIRCQPIRAALRAINKAGKMDDETLRGFLEAHDFLRRLINALRILRGNARDLVLPERVSNEFIFLARRMGYEPGSEAKLAEDLVRHRTFVVRQVDWEKKSTEFDELEEI